MRICVKSRMRLDMVTVYRHNLFHACMLARRKVTVIWILENLKKSYKKYSNIRKLSHISRTRMRTCFNLGVLLGVLRLREFPVSEQLFPANITANSMLICRKKNREIPCVFPQLSTTPDRHCLST